MPTVSDTPIPSASELSNALVDAYAGEPTVADPLALFATFCIQSISSGDATTTAIDGDAASIATGKRGTTSRGVNSPSPRRKRRHKPSSLPKKAALAVTAAVVTELSQSFSGIANPPNVRRIGLSPTSVIDNVFEVQSALHTKKRTSHTSKFIGHVPKTKLFAFCRDNHFDTKIKYTDKEISEGLASCRRKILYHFTKTSNCDVRGEEPETPVEDSGGPNTRSSVDEIEDWMVDMSAADLTTTNIRRLSIYPIEQLLLCGERQRLLMLVRQSAADMKLGTGIAETVAQLQNSEPILISGVYYHRLQCIITDAEHNKDARGEGLPMPKARFEKDFTDRKAGFGIQFVGCETKMHLNWQDVVDHGHLLKFFGPPLSFSRSFDTAFIRVSNKSTLYHRFHCFYNEFEGDVVSCLALYNAYINRRLAATEEKLEAALAKSRQFNKNLFKTKPVLKFVNRFDDHCRQSLQSVFEQFKSHSDSVVSTEDMKAFIAEAPEVFGGMWHLLCDLRGVKPKQAAEKERNVAREHAVFFEILTMIRIANRRRLQYWALIQNITNYARGVSNKAEMALAYFGSTVSTTTRRRKFASLTGNDAEGLAKKNTLKDKHSRLLRGSTYLILCYDNYQRGLSLQHQRGEHSTAFFKGTHQCAHKVEPFVDDSFDAYFVEFTQHLQAIPSPWGMPMYESLDMVNVKSLTKYLIGYPDINATFIATPDFTGKRVEKYIEVRDIMNHLIAIERGFPTSSVDDESEYFDQCPASFNQASLTSFAERCRTNGATLLFQQAKGFQRASVRSWNPKVDEPTKSVYLGLLAIDEAASKECGAITLDLLLRAGVLIANEVGSWELADNYQDRCVYLYGDAKTVENMTKFVRDMQDRRISYSKANMQSEIFLEALTVVQQLPGDWHTGMNSLQSIYNLYYVGFLDKFQELMGWKNISSDVRSCYYQAARLVTFVLDELTRFLAHQFVSTRASQPDDKDFTDQEYITRITSEWMVFLRCLKNSEDKWIAVCANFMEMSYDFLQFVNAYRLNDAIGIEYGYKKHSTVFEFLGQNKYVNIIFAQNETLYRDMPYSVLQTQRMHRCVRRLVGKRCVAQDEFLENGNSFFSEFPVPRSMEGFEEQSNYVGVGLMCKHYSDRWYTTTWKDEFEHTYNHGVAPNMAPEKKMIYEVFRLLGTHVMNCSRVSFPINFVTSIKDKITTELRRDTLERCMKDGAKTSADDILKSLNQVYEESIQQIGLNVMDDVEEDGELDAEDGYKYEEEVALPQRQSTARSKVSRKTMHNDISKDPWKLGQESFDKKDVIGIRAEGVRRRERKSQVRKCILNGIHESMMGIGKLEYGDEQEEVPEWQAFTRHRPNNLGLR